MVRGRLNWLGPASSPETATELAALPDSIRGHGLDQALADQDPVDRVTVPRLRRSVSDTSRFDHHRGCARRNSHIADFTAVGDLPRMSIDVVARETPLLSGPPPFLGERKPSFAAADGSPSQSTASRLYLLTP